MRRVEDYFLCRSSAIRAVFGVFGPIWRVQPARGLRAGCALALALVVLTGTASNFERMQQFVSGRFGAEGVQNLRDWRDTLQRLAGQTEVERLRRVNEFFNRRIRFQEDIAVWSSVDYWAHPVETLGRGAGDCEDFAIAKYFSLIELGVPAAQLRLTYVRARIGAPGSSVSQAHMVLGYYASPEAEPLVLDNLVTEILPAGRRPDLTPVFSFNGEGVWMSGADRPASPVDRLTRWTDLVVRMRAVGYEP